MLETVEFLKGFDLQNLLTVIGVVWFFTNSLKKKIEVLDNRIFQVAMGKSLKQALTEEIKQEEK